MTFIKKRRVTTTISEKHFEILKKNTEKYDTQQKVLETSLDLLENNSLLGQTLTKQDEIWLRTGRELKSASVLLNKPIFEEFIRSSDEEKISGILAITKPAEVIVSWYYQKPLKNCSLKEVVEGICLAVDVGNWFNAVTKSDLNGFFEININHSLDKKGSRIFNQYFTDLFEAYGVRVESQMSDVNLYLKIFKND